MSRADEVYGVVQEERPNSQYLVKLESDERDLLCYLGGKLKMNHVRIVIGDRVRILPDKYGGNGTNRITWRV